MSNKYLGNIIILLLVVSLSFNIFAFKKICSLRDGLKNQDARIQQVINEYLGPIKSKLDRIEEQNNWLTPVVLKAGETAGESQALVFSWQVKEYPVGAPVILYYRLDNEDDFIPVKAESAGGGNFTVQLQIPKSLKPEWSIKYLDEASDLQPPKTSHKIEGTDGGTTLNYYITMQDGNKVFTSEEKSVNISKIVQVAAPINISVSYSQGEYRITLAETQKEKPEITIKQAALEIYKDGNKLEEIPFKKKTPLEEQGRQEIWRSPLFEAVWTSDKNSGELSFYIEVVYSNGKVIRRAI